MSWRRNSGSAVLTGLCNLRIPQVFLLGFPRVSLLGVLLALLVASILSLRKGWPQTQSIGSGEVHASSSSEAAQQRRFLMQRRRPTFLSDGKRQDGPRSASWWLVFKEDGKSTLLGLIFQVGLRLGVSCGPNPRMIQALVRRRQCSHQRGWLGRSSER